MNKSKKTSVNNAPRARSCYICGRQYMLHSFAIHEAQCRDMFEKWESKKPPKDRRKCPDDPMKGFHVDMTISELDKLNAASHQVWNEKSLSKCQNCGRTFLPEKLIIHQRSCTENNPAKRFDSNNLPNSVNNSNNSISQSIKLSDFRPNYGKCDVDSQEVIDVNSGNLMQCKNCSRTFNAISYSKHVKVCVKVFSKQRKVFDSAKHRALGTELEDFNRHSSGRNKQKMSTSGPLIDHHGSIKNINAARSKLQGEIAGEIPKWKLDSLNFRQAMKAAKQVSKAEQQSKATGIPLHKLLPSNTASGGQRDYYGNDYNNSSGSGGVYDGSGALLCPTCGRTFNQKAGERHIPQCKNIINKPSRLSRGSGVLSYSMPSSSSQNTTSRITPRKEDLRSYNHNSSYLNDTSGRSSASGMTQAKGSSSSNHNNRHSNNSSRANSSNVDQQLLKYNDNYDTFTSASSRNNIYGKNSSAKNVASSSRNNGNINTFNNTGYNNNRNSSYLDEDNAEINQRINFSNYHHSDPSTGKYTSNNNIRSGGVGASRQSSDTRQSLVATTGQSSTTTTAAPTNKSNHSSNILPSQSQRITQMPFDYRQQQQQQQQNLYNNNYQNSMDYNNNKIGKYNDQHGQQNSVINSNNNSTANQNSRNESINNTRGVRNSMSYKSTALW